MTFWLVAITLGLVGGVYGEYPTSAECEADKVKIEHSIDDAFQHHLESPGDRREDFKVMCWEGKHSPNYKDKLSD